MTMNPTAFLLSFGIGLLVFGLVMTYGAQINSDSAADVSGAASQVANNTTDGILSMAKKQGTLGTIGVAVVVISLLVTGFGGIMFVREK